MSEQNGLKCLIKSETLCHDSLTATSVEGYSFKKKTCICFTINCIQTKLCKDGGQ